MPARADEYGARSSTRNQIVLERLRGTCPLDARRCCRSASPGRCCAPRAIRGSCARPPRTAPTATSTSRSRSARWATTTTASRAPGRDLRVGEDRRAGARRPARGTAITRTARSRSLPRHELATSMEALIHHFKLVHRGLPRAAGRGLLPDRVAPRRARLLRALWTAASKPAPRCTCATELRQPAGALAHGRGPYIADMIATVAMLDPILGGIDR